VTRSGFAVWKALGLAANVSKIGACCAEPRSAVSITMRRKAIIFDLDSCLAGGDEVGEQLFAPAFASIRAANYGGVRPRD